MRNTFKGSNWVLEMSSHIQPASKGLLNNINSGIDWPLTLLTAMSKCYFSQQETMVNHCSRVTGHLAEPGGQSMSIV